MEDHIKKALDAYKNDLERIKKNISIIDNKFGGKFAKKLEEADLRLEEKLSTINSYYESDFGAFKEKLLTYDAEYIEKLNYIEKDFDQKNFELIEKNKLEINEYTGKIEALMSEITGVRQFVTIEMNELLENNKNNFMEFVKNNTEEIQTSLNATEEDVKQLILNYKNQINKIKDSLHKIDERIINEINAKMQKTDSVIEKRISLLNDSYAQRVTQLFDRITELENKYQIKLNEYEEEVSKRNETYINEAYSKIQEAILAVQEVKISASNMKDDMQNEIYTIIETGKNDLVETSKNIEKLQVDLDSRINHSVEKAHYHFETLLAQTNTKVEETFEQHNNSFKANLSRYHEEINDFKNEITHNYESLFNDYEKRYQNHHDKADNLISTLEVKVGSNIESLEKKIEAIQNGFSADFEMFSSTMQEKNQITLKWDGSGAIFKP